MRLKFNLLPILGKLLADGQSTLDHGLLPGDAAASTRGCRRGRCRTRGFACVCSGCIPLIGAIGSIGAIGAIRSYPKTCIYFMEIKSKHHYV